MTLKRYLATVLTLTILITVSLSLFNAVVDPGNLFGWVHAPGFNAIKPQQGNYRIAWKARVLETEKPMMVFFGNSRVEVGINPDTVQAQALLGTISRFNSAQAASTLYGIRRFVQHAIATGAARQHILIGLDYAQFMQYSLDADRVLWPTFEKQLAVSIDGNPQSWHALHQILPATVSVDALSDSINTLRHQADEDAEFSAHGQVLNAMLRYKTLQKSSPRDVFLNEANRWAGVALGAPAETRRIAEGIAHLRYILLLAREHNIRVSLWINPAHMLVQQLDLLRDGGAGYYHWRYALTETIATVQKMTPASTTTIELWDFTASNDITSEPLPKSGSRDFMRYYLDASHYNEQVGDLILETLVSGKPALTPLGKPFGERLERQTIQAVNARHKSMMVHWMSVHHDLAAVLQDMTSQSGLTIHH